MDAKVTNAAREDGFRFAGIYPHNRYSKTTNK